MAVKQKDYKQGEGIEGISLCMETPKHYAFRAIGFGFLMVFQAASLGLSEYLELGI